MHTTELDNGVVFNYNGGDLSGPVWVRLPGGPEAWTTWDKIMASAANAAIAAKLPFTDDGKLIALCLDEVWIDTDGPGAMADDGIGGQGIVKALAVTHWNAGQPDAHWELLIDGDEEPAYWDGPVYSGREAAREIRRKARYAKTLARAKARNRRSDKAYAAKVEARTVTLTQAREQAKATDAKISKEYAEERDKTAKEEGE